MKRRFVRSLAVAALLLSLIAPLAAHAAPATVPSAGGNVDVQSWEEGGQLVVVTAVTLPPSAKLPTIVRVPLATGATIQWAGEVLGGDVSADPARKYVVKTSPVGGAYAEYTLETTRLAQVDCVVPSVTTSQNSVKAAFEWVQSVSSPSTSFSVRTPANASHIEITPKPSGAPEVNAAGESLWVGDPLIIKPGQKQAVTFAYALSAGGKPTPAAAAGSTNSIVIFLVVALVIAVGVVIWLFARQARSSTPSEPAGRPTRTSNAATRADETEPEAVEPDENDWGFDDEE